MMKKENDEKLKISSKRIIIIFAILFVVFEVIFYVSFQNKQFWPLEESFYIYTPAILVVTVIFCVISITQTYYKVDKLKITHVKMGKEFEFYFKDIIYIDEEWSKKHKMLLFYTSDGKSKFLTFDKNGVIFEYALQYSRLISKEEFKMRFPNVKL